MPRTKSLIRFLLIPLLTIGLATAVQAGVGITPTATPTASATPSVTATPTATPTASGTPSGTPSGSPSPTATPTASGTPSGTPSGSPSPTATPTPSPSPTATPTFSPSPTATPTFSPSPTATPTATPTGELDHYLCYKAGNAWGSDIFPKTEVTLSDQFQERTTTLIKPMHYCNAVDKNGEGVGDPDAHLTCYKAKKAVRINPQVPSTDQFGQQELSVQKQTTQLCVPTQQIDQPMVAGAIVANGAPMPAGPDDLDLYKAKTTRGTPKFERREVSLVDQWIDENVTLTKPVRLGVPTSVDQDGIFNPNSQLTCYKLTKVSKFEKRNVEIENRFGEFTLTVRKPNMLCVPSNEVGSNPT